MRFLRCVHAEWLLVAPRLTRTRLGFSLLALGITLAWLRSRGLDAGTVALQAGALGAIISAAGISGDTRDGPAFATALTHPTTSLAIALGRWVAAVVPACLLTLVCTVVVGGQIEVALAGLVAAAAVGSCALAMVVLLGNGAALALFLFMAVAGAVAPERLVDLARPGVVRVAAASALELGPALWHYRDLANDGRALLHALAWTVLGVLLASASVARRRAA